MRRWLAALGLLFGTSACAENSSIDSPTLAADESPVERVSAAEVPSAFEAETAVYRCRTESGEIHLVTRTRERGLHLFLPPGVAAGHLDCDYDHRASIWEHAKLNGASFRALGNEPGWVLEIRDGDRLDLSYDYGQRQLSAPITDFTTNPDARTSTYSATYTTADGERSMIVRLSGEGCSDTMSDETFPTRVEVEFDGRTLFGCGRPLH